MSVLEDRAYQDESVELAVASLRSVGGYALFTEQRTGKTPMAMRVVNTIRPTRLLITCPEIAIQVWEQHRELLTFDNIEIRVVTRDSLWSQRKKLKRWLNDPYSFVLADEGHDFKGKNSKRSRALRILGRVARYRLLLTGTPQESGLEDYWPQMEFVDHNLLGDWKFFQGRYLTYGGFRNKKIVGYKNQEEFRRLLRRRSIRVLLEDVKPVKTDIAPPNVVKFDLAESREPYRRMEEDLIAEVNQTVMSKTINAAGEVRFVPRRKRVVAPRAITQAMKLHQLSGGFLMDSSGNVHRFGYEKLEAAGMLMLEIGEVPQVWFARFVPELGRLGQLFTFLGRRVTYISGKRSMRVLAPDQEPFVSGSKFDIAVVQEQSGKSIDMAHAEEAIFYSWGHSHLNHDQAKFRIRSFHGLRARYHYLVARGTIDEDLLDCVLHKHSFAKRILDKYRYRRLHGREKKDPQ